MTPYTLKGIAPSLYACLVRGEEIGRLRRLHRTRWAVEVAGVAIHEVTDADDGARYLLRIRRVVRA